MAKLVRTAALCLGIFLLGASSARGEIVLTLGIAGDASTIGQTSFQVVAGGTLRLDLYATQQGQVATPFGSFGDTRLSFVSDMTGAGTYLAEVLTLDSTGTNPSTEILPTSNITAGAGFTFDNGPSVRENIALFGALGGAGDINNIVPVYASNTRTGMQNVDIEGTPQENSVLLATFGIAAAPTASGTSQVQIKTFGDNFGFTLGNTALGSGLTLPPISATVTAVPEPGVFAALGVLACGFGIVQRRKAKRRQAAATAC